MRHWMWSAGNLDPTGCSFESACGGVIEGDRCAGSVLAYEVDDLLEQFRVAAHTATDDDALPRLAAQGSGEGCLHVVAPVQTNQTEFGSHAVIDECSPADINGVRYRPRIPRPRYPVRIKTDHQHAGRQDSNAGSPVQVSFT
jgi:hypothetical protein